MLIYKKQTRDLHHKMTRSKIERTNLGPEENEETELLHKKKRIFERMFMR